MLHRCRINVASIGLGLFPCPCHWRQPGSSLSRKTGRRSRAVRGGGSSAFRRLRPSRRKILVTVEIGMASRRAIAGELIRCRRRRSTFRDLLGRRPALTGGRRALVMEAPLAARPPAPHPISRPSGRQRRTRRRLSCAVASHQERGGSSRVDYEAWCGHSCGCSSGAPGRVSGGRQPPVSRDKTELADPGSR
jgi:hypothetical protein